jgi:catalase
MTRSKASFGSLALIAAAPLALIAGFAWAGGWIGPARVGGGTVANALESNGGKYSGYRRAHAKGLCVTGHFEANGAGTALSKALMFAAGSYPVIGRFSTGGGNPFATDGRNVFHALALQMTAPDGQIWRMAMDHTAIFPVGTLKAFIELQRATTPDPATGKPDPAVMKAYLAEHPETRAYQDYIAATPLPNSFATGTYYSINAFRFADAGGQGRIVRWAFVPEAAFGALDKAKLADLPTDYLFNEMVARLGKGAVRWHMVVTIAAPGDVSDNATVQWPAGRQTLDVGTLVLDRTEAEEQGKCRDITFDPTILPAGVGLSDDPLLAARSAAYAVSFKRRAIEGAGPSAIGKTLGAAK